MTRKEECVSDSQRAEEALSGRHCGMEVHLLKGSVAWMGYSAVVIFRDDDKRRRAA